MVFLEGNNEVSRGQFTKGLERQAEKSKVTGSH